MRALLVEGDEADALLLQELLEELRDMRFVVHHVTQLADAVGLLGRQEFDLMLLDLSLPDAQGMRTLIEMAGVTRDVAVVVLAGVDDDELTLRAMQDGATAAPDPA